MLPTKEFFESVLRERLEDKSIIVKEIMSKNTDSVGFHITSNHGFFNASYVDGNGNEKEMSVFVKRQVADPVLKKPTAGSDEIFRKETLFYERLHPDMVRFCQKYAKRPVDISKIPRFLYSAKDEEGWAMIAMEDVRVRGFEVLTAIEEQLKDVVRMKLILELLATMHAVTYAMQKKKDIDMTKTYYFLQNGLIQEQNYKLFMTKTLKAAADLLISEPGNEQLAQKILKLQPHVWNLFLEGLEPRKTFSTVCHGDTHASNMVFRKDANGKHDDVLLLDWQAVRYSSVVTDIHSTLAYVDQSTDANELKRFYYDTFKDTVDAFGLADDLFTFEDFLGEIDDLKVLQFTSATMEVAFCAFHFSGILAKAMSGDVEFFPFMSEQLDTISIEDIFHQEPMMKPYFIYKLKGFEKYVDDSLQALNL